MRRRDLINRKTPRHLIVVFLCLSVISASCTSDGDGQRTESSAEVAALAVGTTEFQRAILEDGIVTRAEYEGAMLATRACVGSLGFLVGALQTVTEDGTLLFAYGGTDEPEELDSADSCFEEYSGAVSLAWLIQVAPTEEEIQRRMVAFRDCLVDSGNDWVPLPGSRGDASKLAGQIGEDGIRCQSEAKLSYDIYFEHDITTP